MSLTQQELNKLKTDLQNGFVSKLDAIKAILSNNIVAEKEAKAYMRHEKARIKVNCKQYKIVHITSYCRHCGSSKNREVQLTPKEHVGVVNYDNRYYEVNYYNIDSLIRINSYTHACDSCNEYIKNMSRDDLEKRYKELLKHHVTFTDNILIIDSKGHQDREDWPSDSDNGNNSTNNLSDTAIVLTTPNQDLDIESIEAIAESEAADVNNTDADEPEEGL